MAQAAGALEVRIEDGTVRATVRGAWTIVFARDIQRALDAVGDVPSEQSMIDASSIEAFDSTGAWLLARLHDRLSANGGRVEITGLGRDHATLFERVREIRPYEPAPGPDYHPLVALVERSGRSVCRACADGMDLLNFLGMTTTAMVRSVFQPRRIRLIPAFSHIERVGLDALPIVGLLSFLIGVVLAYQGADQLRRFGAEIFTVNLLGVSILREMGVLLTAIIVAGRSGSAFAAEIGTMQVNQEIDAMRTLGLDPVDMLVIPRVAAMIIVLPLLAVYADIMGLLGGGIMAVLNLDIPLVQFLDRLRDAVSESTYWVGIAKAPVFGLLIALTGCREGLLVTGSAESVGLHTTRSVVISIFLVIIVDAIFSIIFAMFRL